MSSALLGIVIHAAVRCCVCMYTLQYSSRLKLALGGLCMQQWYEFTTTKGAAGISLYINIPITAKGAELC